MKWASTAKAKAAAVPETAQDTSTTISPPPTLEQALTTLKACGIVLADIAVDQHTTDAHTLGGYNHLMVIGQSVSVSFDAYDLSIETIERLSKWKHENVSQLKTVGSW